jgi:hypothetical protein
MQKLDERSALLYHPVNDLAGAAGPPINIADAELKRRAIADGSVAWELVTRNTMIGVTVARVRP